MFKIRQWFKKEEKNKSTERGLLILKRLQNRLKINNDLQEISEKLNYQSLDELASLIGSGSINTPTLVKNLSKFALKNANNITIQVDAEDRVGLIRDITNIISNEGLNISSLSTIELETGKSIVITVDSNGLQQQNKIYSIIETVKGVKNIETISN